MTADPFRSGVTQKLSHEQLSPAANSFSTSNYLQFRRMSPSGQSRRFRHVRGMSGYLSIATKQRTLLDVRNVPILLQKSEI
jgi:hypothetical protein